jgi:hypothetical protein
MGRKYLETRTIRDDGEVFFFFPGVVKIEDAGGVGEVLMVFGREREGEEEMERPRRDYEDEERDKADYE